MSAVESIDLTSRIAAVRGLRFEPAQPILWQFAQDLKRRGLRVGGVVEFSQCASEGACSHLTVRDLISGASISISQDLGPGSTACNLDPYGLAQACANVERAIGDGVDVVVLSKFGKLEAARGGLCDAFRAAILAGLPIITAVSEGLTEDWSRFAGALSDDVAPTMQALDAWWSDYGKSDSAWTPPLPVGLSPARHVQSCDAD
ncbi:DUF2478 domain-containing protein [Methylocapsa palsarum]|uniref:DUF2478 domain-containing protein n=1 Tax=Methylocapsa palsarum TaxID=1612308 RepID=A0A1I4CAZ0_9HYPH|nr:DUF2478 domain-containing protein [Methylocapsa palsarum]SFK77449.1 Protein of unknown function [Methylocapsa palsarum]